jgi:uroporphyrinogen-III synthase
MSDTEPLAGRCFWLTRPATQVQELQQALEKLGARILTLPLLAIEPVPLAGVNKQRLMNLDAYDLVFFVSSNAANIGLSAIGDYWPQYPAHILNFAVGPGTAKVVQSHGLDVFYPTDRMSSEAMLALPELQHIGGRKALIVRGVGGREILAQGLLERGASVDYAELYERRLPHYEPGHLQKYLQHHPHAVIISSAEALDNLCQLLKPLGEDWRQLPLHVSSDRLAIHAKELGFADAHVLEGASDAAIIDGLLSTFAPTAPR